MAPFPRPDGQLWTSESSRSTAAFGYTYPELANADTAAIKASINRLYGPILPTNRKRQEAGQEVTNWDANIKAQKHGLDGTYFIYVFLGKFSDEPEKWQFDENLVGLHAIFSSSSSEDPSIGNEAGLEISGSVPLTKRLQDLVSSGELASMKDEDVVAYLAADLQWRIALVSNNIDFISPRPPPRISRRAQQRLYTDI